MLSVTGALAGEGLAIGRAAHRRPLLGRHPRPDGRPRRARGGARRPDRARRRRATRSSSTSTRDAWTSRSRPRSSSDGAARWPPPEPHYTGGVMAKYAALVSSASEGAVTNGGAAAPGARGRREPTARGAVGALAGDPRGSAFKTSPQDVPGPTLDATWRGPTSCRRWRRTSFDGVWMNDHLTDLGRSAGPVAGVVHRCRHARPPRARTLDRHSVLSNTFRHRRSSRRRPTSWTGDRRAVHPGARRRVARGRAPGVRHPAATAQGAHRPAGVGGRRAPGAVLGAAAAPPGVTRDDPFYPLRGATLSPTGHAGGPPVYLGGQGPRGPRARRAGGPGRLVPGVNRRRLVVPRTKRDDLLGRARDRGPGSRGFDFVAQIHVRDDRASALATARSMVQTGATHLMLGMRPALGQRRRAAPDRRRRRATAARRAGVGWSRSARRRGRRRPSRLRRPRERATRVADVRRRARVGDGDLPGRDAPPRREGGTRDRRGLRGAHLHVPGPTRTLLAVAWRPARMAASRDRLGAVHRGVRGCRAPGQDRLPGRRAGDLDRRPRVPRAPGLRGVYERMRMVRLRVAEAAAPDVAPPEGTGHRPRLGA